ncbi:MAG: TIM barrel protein [Planctomycetes bacterium]|nr:TIM barrel protein [Planctomycetota bacterium]
MFVRFTRGPELCLKEAQGLGITAVQALAPPAAARTPADIEKTKAACKATGVTITVVFCEFEGESYADIPTVHKTVGLVPPATRAARIAETMAISDYAKALGVDTIGMHIGAVPADPKDPEYQKIVDAARQVCDHAAKNNQRFHLETGQETADCLHRFIQDVKRDNLAVNFDPANMILYGVGEPLPALRKVGKYVKSCHCKDAKWSAVKGQWGQETPLGQGAVGMRDFLLTLKEIGYAGPLTIEREITGPEQLKDIRAAKELLETIKKEIA